MLEHSPAEEDREEERPIWEEIVELMKDVPDEEWKTVPVDGSGNLDHYLYEAPKYGSPWQEHWQPVRC